MKTTNRLKGLSLRKEKDDVETRTGPKPKHADYTVEKLLGYKNCKT